MTANTRSYSRAGTSSRCFTPQFRVDGAGPGKDSNFDGDVQPRLIEDVKLHVSVEVPDLPSGAVVNTANWCQRVNSSICG